MPEPDRYLGATNVEVSLAGARFTALVHIGEVEGRYACVGLELNSFYQTADELGQVVESPIGETLAELTTPRLRALRLGEVVQEALSKFRALTEEAVDYPGVSWSEQEMTELQAVIARLVEQEAAPRRPGRPRRHSEAEVLEVVVSAYRGHKGRQPVKAVRDALAEAKVLSGSGPDGAVTIDQARAAVRRARDLGVLERKERS